jgi:hypothetical protein
MLVALSGGALLATITTIGITPFLLAIATWLVPRERARLLVARSEH